MNTQQLDIGMKPDPAQSNLNPLSVFIASIHHSSHHHEHPAH